MSEEKRYYWLKLPKDFFSGIEIKRLRKLAGGDTYTVIYLKMLLLSLETNGIIQFQGICKDIIEEVALEVDEQEDDVRVVFQFLTSTGLLEPISEIEYELTQTKEMTGSETATAKRVRKHRRKKALEEQLETEELERNKDKKMLQGNGQALPGNADVTKGNTEIEIEKEIEIEREVEGEEKTSTPTLHERIIDSWNSLGLQGLRTISNQRKTLLGARLKEFGEESIFEAIEKIRDSDFLKGQNRRGWVITFDWLIKPNNYVKVLEGNYNDEEKQTSPKKKPKGQNFERREIKDDEISRKIQEDLLREYMEATGKL